MSGKPQSATIVCAKCGKVMERTGGHQKYCPECAKESTREYYRRLKAAARAQKEPPTIVCALCGKVVPKTSPTQRYCRDCSDAIRHPHSTGKRQGPRFRLPKAEAAPKTLRGLSIVEADRLAKEQHTSYGKIVAGLENLAKE